MQLKIQSALMAVAFVCHYILVKSGVGRYTKEAPEWYDILNLTLMVSTTTGMTTCMPENLPAMIVTWVHTLLIFIVIAL